MPDGPSDVGVARGSRTASCSASKHEVTARILFSQPEVEAHRPALDTRRAFLLARPLLPLLQRHHLPLPHSAVLSPHPSQPRSPFSSRIQSSSLIHAAPAPVPRPLPSHARPPSTLPPPSLSPVPGLSSRSSDAPHASPERTLYARMPPYVSCTRLPPAHWSPPFLVPEEIRHPTLLLSIHSASQSLPLAAYGHPAPASLFS